MVQTTYPSDQKYDLTQLRHAARNAQSAVRRRKGTKSHRDGDSKSPTLPPVNRFHQVLLYVNREGIIQVDSAPTVTVDERRQILQAALPKYREALERIKANPSQPSFAIKPDAACRTSHAGMQYQSKGNGPVPHQRYTVSNTQSPKRPKKRLRASSEDGSPGLQDDSSSQVTERSNSIGTVENQTQLIPIEIRDFEKLKEYLFDAFTSFQQINCRTLCKSWIRTIEPKKQVNHPYNGNLKVKGGQKFPPNDLSTQKDSDPEETKPKWWPSKEECPHKEPDHIKKEQRLALLCHILMNTRDLHDCSTDDLKAALESDKAKIKPAGKEAILDDVWKIGRQLERFKDGGEDGTNVVYVNARKEEARMIRGGGRSKKALDAKDESEDEESSPDAENIPEEVKTLTPTTPSALASSISHLHADQAPMAPQARIDECRYVEDPSTHHFRPPETKENYQDQQAEYPMPVEVNSSLGDLSHHGSSAHVFDGEAFVEHAYGNMQDIRSHADMFSPDEQQIIGQWAITATPDLYAMHYTGEPSQPPTINPPDGNHIFGHYPYGASHKQAYRNEGYSADIHGHFPAGCEDDLTRFQRVNACSFPSHSTPRFHSGNIMHQHSYELPSHIRA